jgi:hypothetical protein
MPALINPRTRNCRSPNLSLIHALGVFRRINVEARLNPEEGSFPWCVAFVYLHKDRDETVTEQTQYYVYVLEANLVFPNELTIPLMSEFLSSAEVDPATSKQDCELKAFPPFSRENQIEVSPAPHFDLAGRALS